MPRQPPCVVGYEVAGYMDAVGTGVTSRREGDRVMALTQFGGYSDTVVVPAHSPSRRRRGCRDAEAAAVPVTYLTASVAFYRMAALEAGETVLVHGAAGGVGTAAMQLARLRGAVIIGTASAAKHDAVRGFGADHVIDYRHADVSAEVMRLTGNRGVDVVLDPVGGRSFRESYALLAPLGRLVVFGVSQTVPGSRRSLWRAARLLLQMPAFRPLSLMNHNRGVFGLNLGRLWSEAAKLGSSMALLLSELEAGRLQPVVARDVSPRAGGRRASLPARATEHRQGRPHDRQLVRTALQIARRQHFRRGSAVTGAADQPRRRQRDNGESELSIQRHDAIGPLIRQHDRTGMARQPSAARCCAAQSKPPVEYCVNSTSYGGSA